MPLDVVVLHGELQQPPTAIELRHAEKQRPQAGISQHQPVNVSYRLCMGCKPLECVKCLSEIRCNPSTDTYTPERALQHVRVAHTIEQGFSTHVQGPG